ncbi:unnamed protein product [Ectocarpus sp. 6 AP-2014]
MFTIDVMQKKAPREAQKQVLTVKATNTLLEEPISDWNTKLPLFRTVLEDVEVRDFNGKVTDYDYSEKTILGTGPEFMKPFEDALKNYDNLYSEKDWLDHDKRGQTPNHIKSPFQQGELRDPSFAQKTRKIQPDEKFIFVGDIHSSFHSFVEVINDLVCRNILSNDLVLHDKYWLVFLGDILDRGPYGLDILNIIFQIKNKNFERVIVINGNHEDKSTYSVYGTGKEIITQLGNKTLAQKKNQQTVHAVLRRLPPVLFIDTEKEGVIQCCHAGIDPEYEPKTFLDQSAYQFEFHGFDDPPKLKFRGLRWTDFGIDMDGRGGTSQRAEYGVSATTQYLQANNIVGMIRGHQDIHSIALLPRFNAISTLQSIHFKRPTYGRARPDGEPHGVLIPTKQIPREPNPYKCSFRRIPLVDVFREYCVVTTSTAVRARGTLHHHTYLELSSAEQHIKDAQLALGKIDDSELQGLLSDSNDHSGLEEEIKHLKEFNGRDTLKTTHFCRFEEVRDAMGENFDDHDCQHCISLYELLSWKPFKPPEATPPAEFKF